jgi:PAS domain S-box-containing protein
MWSRKRTGTYVSVVNWGADGPACVHALQVCRAQKEVPMSYSAPEQAPRTWLQQNGPVQLELLFRSVAFRPTTRLLLVDDERTCQKASAGSGRIVGVAPAAIPLLKIDDLVADEFLPQLEERWRAFLTDGEQEGVLPFERTDGTRRQIGYTARKHVLPGLHLITLCEWKEDSDSPDFARASIGCHVVDSALLLLEPEGNVAGWYSGAERMYGHTSDEIAGQPLSALYTPDGHTRTQEELNRALSAGHSGVEGWSVRKDGSRFWANAVTMALHDGQGTLQGFARVVRDFTDRRRVAEALQRATPSQFAVPAPAGVAGIASGELDGEPEMNDALLDLLGYARTDVSAGLLKWADLTPEEYAALDDSAHEEVLRFGASTPFEKEMIRKDGSRVRVMVTTAGLKVCPLRWITFVQDLRGRDTQDAVEQPDRGASPVFTEIVGESAALRRVLRQVEVVAPTDATVLILGETGTGKELIARAIHTISPRRSMPFISLNCAAIPTGLLESELFGYERGAFTGALTQKIGRFEMAHRGTLFLDEIGDIPLELQPKLLRALQEHSFERLGGTRTIPIDVRLVAATNRNLSQMMEDKLFRSDLYYRLKVFPLTAPPLRDRPEDIPVLARYFTKKYATKMSRDIEKIPAETMRQLSAWHWPGNVRELENFIERAVILSPGVTLRAPLADIRSDQPQHKPAATLEQVERDHVLRVLREANGVVTTAATRLGLHRTTLNALMKRLGIARKEF